MRIQVPPFFIVKKRIILCLLLTIISCKNKVDYYNLSTYTKNKTLNAVIEIPAGTNKKFEYNKETHTFEIDKKKGKDRVIQFLSYPGNYGYIPSTFSDPKKGGDGDALDILVLSEAVPTGTILEVLPIAVLKLIDNGEFDYKIIAIPKDTSNQIIKANSYKELTEKFPKVIKIIELWFLNYNKEDKAIIEGWGTEMEAIDEIRKNQK